MTVNKMVPCLCAIVGVAATLSGCNKAPAETAGAPPPDKTNEQAQPPGEHSSPGAPQPAPPGGPTTGR